VSLWRRFWFLLHRERFREELEEEMRFHLEQRGRLGFGNPGLIQEQSQDAWGLRWLDDLGQDVRYAVRALARSPGFAVAALLTLALGIGATTAVFSAVDAALLRPLPFVHADRLVVLDGTYAPPPAGYPKNYLAYTDWEARPDLFQRLAAFDAGGANLLTGDRATRIGVAVVTPGFFATFAVPPLLGRSFTRDESTAGHEQVIILSYQLWRRQFGGDSTVLGRTLILQNLPYVVVGVMPEAFRYPRETDAWVPNVAGTFLHWDLYRTAVVETVIARLADRVSVPEAQARVTAMEEAWGRDHPSPYTPPGVHLIPLRARLVGSSGTALLVLFGAVGFILLIACTNTAGLLVARSVSRGHEMSLRAMLGASRRRVVRQLLTESGVLAFCGGALGLAVAWGVGRALMGLLPPALGDLMPMSLDARVLGFALLATLVATFLFGLAPALTFSGQDLQGPLQRSGGRATSARVTRTRRVLATGEIALTLVVLTGAMLLLKSLGRLQAVDPGFRQSGIVAMNVSLTQARYSTLALQSDFYRRALSRLGAVPGVTAVGAVNVLPLSQDGSVGFAFRVEGHPAPQDPDQMQFAENLVVTPGYFRAIGIPLLRGRDFTEADDSAALPVMIISQSMATKYWPGKDPLGTQVTAPGRSAYGKFTVIGIVGDVQDGSLDETNRWPAQMYKALSQAGASYTTLVVRSELDEGAIAPALRHALADVDPTLPVYRMRTLRAVVAASIAPQTLTTTLLTFAGGLAIVIAAVGLYGVIAYGVAQRSRELGIRLALGAQKDQLLRLILRDAIVMTATGVVLGLGTAWLMTRSLAHLLFQVEPRDPGAFALAALVLTAVTLCAAYVPASRAARVDPMTVLRWE